MELKVGQRATRSQTRTLDNVKTYAEITGDYNPLHFDAEFAARTRFGRLIAQGGVTNPGRVPEIDERHLRKAVANRHVREIGPL